eukprot:10029052-Alexandrium_andersonii.AAC.1
MITSRKAVSDYLDDSDATASNIARTLKQKKGFVEQTDRAWKVTEAFWDTCVGSAAGSRVHQAILGCFPEAPAQKAVEAIIHDLGELQKSKLLGFAGVSFQNMANIVKGWVESIKGARPPKLD